MFDEMWYSAEDCNKPTVTPKFVFDSYEKGKLMNPNDYPTRGPEKPRKDVPKKVKSRPAVGGRKSRGRGRGDASFATDASSTEATRETLSILPEIISHKTTPQGFNSQQTDSQQSQFVPERTFPQPTILQPTNHPQVTPRPVIPQQETLLPQQATTQLVVLQHHTTPHENQPPLPPCEKVAEPGYLLVKTEPLDDDHLDFALATEVLLSWEPTEESEAALWKRMNTMVRSLAFFLGLLAINVQFQRSCATASSWEEFCDKHWSRFERFFDSISTRA